MQKIIEYVKEAKSELAHVSWPSRRKAVVSTIIVIVISLATAIYLGIFDTLFTTLIKNFITR